MTRPVTNPDACGAVGAGGVGRLSGGLSSASLSWAAATRQRRCRALQRASLDRGRLHALAGEPGRAADGDELYRHGLAAGTYYYRVDRRGCGRQRRRRPRTRRRRRSATRSRRRRRVRLRRSGRSGRRRCPGRRRPTTSVCCRYNVHRGTTAGFTVRSRQPDRAAEHAGLRRHDRRRAATSTRSPPRTRPATSAPSRTRPRRRCWPTRPRRAQPAGLAALGRPAAPSTSAGPPPPTTSPSSATTSTAAPAPASPPAPRNRIAQPTGPSYADTGLGDRQLLLQGHRRRRRRQHQRRLERGHRHRRRRHPAHIPGSLTATAAGSTVNLSWGAATDNVGVSRYNLHRGTTSGFTPSTANRIAQPTGLSYADTNVAPAATSTSSPPKTPPATSAPSPTPPAPPSLDTSPPSTPTNLTATGGAGQTSLTWTAATDNVAVTRYNLHRSTTSGFTPTTGNRIAQPTTTSYTDTGLAAGTYYYKLTAEDAAGNLSPASNEATATVTHPTRHRPRRRLRPRHRHRHHHHRPIRHRQQRHPHQRHLDRTTRQIRQRTHLQRHQRLRHHPRHQQPRPHHRHDPRSLGPTPPPSATSYRTVDHEGAAREHVVRRSTPTAPGPPRADRRGLRQRLPGRDRHAHSCR